MYARYRTRSRFYKMPSPVLKAYNVNPNVLRKPRVKEGLLGGVYRDTEVDLRDRERLELLETIRHPRERDFYQDHTYHNQWIDRDLDKAQRAQISSRYAYFAPNYVAEPWIWYPGDVVEVVRGEGVGQRGTIIAVIKYKNEILVQNANVQDVRIPASETRPEQVVQREHPISVFCVRHVDPSTDQLCNVELVRVRNKDTGALEEKRISLQSGVLLPIPPPEQEVAVGDPLKDTPMQDAEEATFRAEVEMPLLVERRLRAMEDYFVQTLRQSYEYHEPLRRQNAREMCAFQVAVVDRASEKLADRLARGGGSSSSTEDATAVAGDNAQSSHAAETTREGDGGILPAWLRDVVAPYVETLRDEAREAAAEDARRAAAAAAQRDADASVTSQTGADDAYDDDDDEDGEADDDEDDEEDEDGDDGR